MVVPWPSQICAFWTPIPVDGRPIFSLGIDGKKGGSRLFSEDKAIWIIWMIDTAGNLGEVVRKPSSKCHPANILRNLPVGTPSGGDGGTVVWQWPTASSFTFQRSNPQEDRSGSFYHILSLAWNRILLTPNFSEGDTLGVPFFTAFCNHWHCRSAMVLSLLCNPWQCLPGTSAIAKHNQKLLERQKQQKNKKNKMSRPNSQHLLSPWGVQSCFFFVFWVSCFLVRCRWFEGLAKQHKSEWPKPNSLPVLPL